MANASYQLGVFLHLAQASQRRRRPFVRDRMLLLASVAAVNVDLRKLAAYCRNEILKNNPRHLIGQRPTVEEALLDDDFLALLARIRAKYPIERAERLLDALGIEVLNERDVYYSDEEWAAAILNVAPNSFQRNDPNSGNDSEDS